MVWDEERGSYRLVQDEPLQSILTLWGSNMQQHSTARVLTAGIMRVGGECSAEEGQCEPRDEHCGAAEAHRRPPSPAA